MTAERYDPEFERLAGEPLDGTDRHLLAAVAESYTRIDRVPDRLIARIEYELTLAKLFDDVAQLQQLTGAGARSTAEQIRTITFSGLDVSLMLTLSEASPTEIRVDGWVAPGTGWAVTVSLPQDPERSFTTSTDDHGRFAFAGLPATMAQFTLTRPDELFDHAVTTPPIEL